MWRLPTKEIVIKQFTKFHTSFRGIPCDHCGQPICGEYRRDVVRLEDGKRNQTSLQVRRICHNEM